ncbi:MULTISPECIES: hypothetical protein [Dyella]|uniref:Porin family protein n=2 Tax=Dyella TaxID=231454 RepID=A0A4R0YU29_9GAMM|nr:MULTISPECIES: hypothetical protein [Dyella]TBR39500.1 hypothetical protein EYV96_04615 [Dyella terrae]TCI12915.1 hypothetical protein EZM97_06255 [Dyella soli]
MNQGNSSKLRHASCAALTWAMLAASSSAFADQSPALDRVSIWLGGYWANTDTKIGAGDNGGLVYGRFGLEDDLGFPDHKFSPRARLDWLLGDHQGFSFDYYNINRSETKTLTKDIRFGGNDYLASARVKGKLDFGFGSAAYRWWFGSGQSVFGVGLGAAYYRLRTGLSGEASVGGISGQASSSSDDSAWAPMLQLGWRYAVSDQFRIYIDASGIKKNGGNLNGHIYNAALGLEWFPWQNVGLGAEYGYQKIKLNQRHHDYYDDLNMRVDGPSLFVRFRF